MSPTGHLLVNPSLGGDVIYERPLKQIAKLSNPQEMKLHLNWGPNSVSEGVVFLWFTNLLTSIETSQLL